MAILLPNYLQTGSYAAKKDRRVNSAEVLQEGIVRKGHYAVVQRAAGANMSVDVAAGEAWVKGDSAVDQGFYHVVNDATVNAAVSAANATNPRIDAVVLAVNDSTEVGGSDSYLIEVIAGTPTAGATLSNLNGAPTPGATKLLLSYVLVGAAVTKVENATIGGLRDPKNFAQEYQMTKETPYAVAGAPAQYAHGRPLDYVPACTAKRIANQEIVTGTPTAVTFNAADIYDNDSMHDIVTNNGKLIAATPGLYLFSGALQYNLGVLANIQFARTVGGAGSGGFYGQENTSQLFNISGPQRLGYGDSVELLTTQASGSNKIVNPAYLSAIWQGP